MRNWNVNDLLHIPLLEQGIRQNRRHFHQPEYHEPVNWDVTS